MEQQKPTVGRIVHYIEGDFEGRTYGAPHPDSVGHPGTNATRIHPAIITRVWSDSCVNLHVFFDAHPSTIRTSATRLDTPEGTRNPNSGWRWPART